MNKTYIPAHQQQQQQQQPPQFANGSTKILLNVVLVMAFIALAIYIFNTLTLSNAAGVFFDQRVQREPIPQHNYILRSIDRATWNPPWYNNNNWTRTRCPRGCAFTNRPQDRGANRGFSCPNGPQCFTEGCCKYDRDCRGC